MVVSFEKISIGKEYTIPQLAELWGYENYNALDERIVTLPESNHILLFITEKEQAGAANLWNIIEENLLHIEGEAGHSSDQRLINAEQNGDEIHLFYRKYNDMPFIYYGRIHMIDYELEPAEPSWFCFLLYKKSDITRQFELSFSRRQASYKMVTVLSLLDTSSSNVVSDIDEVARKFMEFYETREKLGAMVEKDKMAMARVHELPFTKVKQVMINNPVMYLRELLEYDKSANLLSFKGHILNNLDVEMLQYIRRIALKNLYDYYDEIEGLCDKGLGYCEQSENFYTQRSVYEVSSETGHGSKKLPVERVEERIDRGDKEQESMSVEKPLRSFSLRECSNIHECENILKDIVGKVKYFGQVELAREDIDLLGDLIRVQIENTLPAGIKYVIKKTPVTLAIFLVGQGIYYYDEGDYWTTVSNSLGVADVSLQVRMGQEYLRILESFDKPELGISDFQAYVANILLHGGIPQSLLPEFFESVTRLLVHKDLIEPDEIKKVVCEWRIEEREYNKVARELFRLNKKKVDCLQKKQQAENVFRLREEIEKLKNEAGDKGFLVNALGEDCEEVWQKYKSEIDKILDKERSLEKENNEYNKKIDGYYQYHAPVLKAADSIQAHIDEYYREKQSLENVPSLEKQYMKRRDELAEKLQNLNGNNSLELQEPYLAELPWEEVISFFREAAELQELLKKNEGRLNKTVVPSEKPGGLVWSGMALTAAGTTLVLLNPAQLVFWLFTFAGVVIVIPGLTGYRSRINAARERRQQKEKIGHNIESIRLNLQEVLEQAYKLAGGFLPDEARADISNDIAGLVEDIRTKYEKYIDAKQSLQVAQQKANELEERITEFANLLGLENIEGKNIGVLFLEAQNRIDEAQSRRKQIVEIESAIKQINSELIDLQDERKEMQGKADYIKGTLSKLGEGDLEHGRQVFAQHKEKQQQINALEKSLSDEVLASYKEELLAYDFSALNTLLNNLNQYIEETDSEIASLQKRMEALTRPLDYMDEPIRRFVLHGDEWAEGWLIESVSMYMKTMTGESFKQGEESPLPVRVVDAFHNWWNEQSSEAVEKGNTQIAVHQKIKTPEIKLAHTGEIYLYFPSQRFYSNEVSSRAWIRIADREDEQLLEDILLEVYKKEGGLLETESTSISVMAPLEVINVAFGFGKDVLQKWSLRLFIENKLPLMIFDERGSLVFSDPLPRERLWFVFEEKIGFKKLLPPLEEDRVNLDKTYYLQLIDTSQFPGEKISVVDANNKQHDLYLTGQGLMYTQLSGKAIDGVMVEETYPLYWKESVEIYVPTVDLDELKDWLIQVRPRAGYPGQEASLNFEELQDLLKVQPGGNMALLPLGQTDLFEQEPCGRHTINIFNPAGEKFNYDVSFVDDLKFSFTPQICPPNEKDDQQIEMKLTCPEDLVFDVFEPAKLTEKRGSVSQVAVSKASNYVHGSLRKEGVEESFFKLPLSIKVPKIRWSLEGLKESAFEVWNEKTEELWLGDWQEAQSLNLKISVPAYLNARASLSLKGTDQHYDREIKKGLAKFDLLPFIDTLKAHSKPAYFYLALYDRDKKENIIECLLFMVRVRWEVEDLSLEQAKEGEAFLYRFKWVDQGKMNNRVLRLWDKDSPFNPPVMEKEIPDDASEIVFNAGLEELPPGQYLAQFIAEDPWEATHAEVSFPQSDYNVFPVEIKGDQALIRDWELCWLKDNEIEVSGRMANCYENTQVDVNIIGRKNGKWINWQASTVTGDKGNFNVVLTAEKYFARWIGITARAEPLAYLYSLLPETAPLIFHFERITQEIEKIVNSNMIRVELIEEDEQGNNTHHYVREGSQLINAIQEGKSAVAFTLDIGGIDTEAKLVIERSAEKYNFNLELKQGTKCTGCGAILMDQKAWFDHSNVLHRRENPNCHKLIPNYTKAKANLSIIWDTTSITDQSEILKTHFCWPVLLVNTNPNTKSNVIKKNRNIADLANELLELEVKWFEKLSKSGLI